MINMKLAILLIFAAVILVGVNAECGCDDDDGKAFIIATGSCDDFPKSGETGFIENCKKYKYDNENTKWECKRCNVQYYKDATGSTCADGGIANCDDYENATTCDGCTDGFYLDGNACVNNPSTPTNCKEFTKGASAAECKYCEDGYYLKAADKTCVENPTTVTGCKEYRDNNGTVECNYCDYANGYTGLDGQTCYKIADKIPDCLSGYTKSSGVYACSGCIDSKMVEDKGSATDACVANPTTEADGKKENCKTYRKSSIDTSCVACNDHFGLKSDGTCEDVGTKVDNCSEYELVANAWKCNDCKSNFYGNTDKPTTCSKCPEIKKGGNGNSATILSVGVALFMLLSFL